jgi:hypothetical protein
MRLWLIIATDLRTREEVCCVYLWAMTNDAAEASLDLLFPELAAHHTDYRALDYDEAVRVPHEAIGRLLTRSEAFQLSHGRSEWGAGWEQIEALHTMAPTDGVPLRRVFAIERRREPSRVGRKAP